MQRQAEQARGDAGEVDGLGQQLVDHPSARRQRPWRGRPEHQQADRQATEAHRCDRQPQRRCSQTRVRQLDPRLLGALEQVGGASRCETTDRVLELQIASGREHDQPAGLVEPAQRDAIEVMHLGELVADGGRGLLRRSARRDGEERVDHRGALAQLVVEEGKPRGLSSKVRGEPSHEFVGVDRLQEIVGGTGAEAGDRAGELVVAGDEEDRQGGRPHPAAQPVQQLGPERVGQPVVEDDGRDRGVDALEGLRRRGRLDALVAGQAQGRDQERAGAVVVVDHQDAGPGQWVVLSSLRLRHERLPGPGFVGESP